MLVAREACPLFRCGLVSDQKSDFPNFTAGKHATIQFDGAMSHSKYISMVKKQDTGPMDIILFHLDITKFLKPDVEILSPSVE